MTATLAPPVVLRTDAGEELPLEPDRWDDEPTAAERQLLADLAAPVLDVGCGPGRLVVGLSRLGRPALGIDPAAGAVQLARQRGAAVLQRSVFDPLPACGRWRTVLLVDGNIGIGGDPVRLLRRCGELASPGGSTVVELDPDDPGWSTHRVRLERGAVRSPWFPWARVGTEGLSAVAAEAGLVVDHVHHAVGEGRRFAHLLAR